MKGLLIFTADDGTEIVFDEYNRDEEYHTVWVTMCGKCLGKYGKYLGHRIADDGGGCCSVCGCDTPDWHDSPEGEDSCYVDFDENEVKEI